ncbi:heparan-alpha-glucosaminide N-acetyltransferase domain-containing protein [Ornithinicoccus hortensis]|uniref:Uncharacterized protein DUF1624 n=1 Tax=Ornithinicoccus hortensis TaxID=82346 RepID=A0A542YU86_9MICO|nr:heparan-alpha-glucosaminide N-acetyltransferase domain-containing protein [Ornithinicoccus hortensis]TQL51650.1 uncharacterized protein DUF1624 [Ornithinicoccus hortensis]
MAPGPARIIGVDLARMLALLGMITAHLVDTYRPDGSVTVWHQIVSGRSAALFAVLAGLSIALVTRRAVDPQRVWGLRAQVAVRALVIACLGLALGMFDSGLAVILTYYGVLFLGALPVLRWGARRLALLAIGWGLASPVASMLLRPHLPPNSYDVPDPLSVFSPWQLVTELTVTGYYPVLTWATYLFAGMAIGRLDLRSAAWGRRLLVWGAWGSVLALAVARLVTRPDGVRTALVDSYDRWERVTDWADLQEVLRNGLYGTTPTGSWWWLGVWSPHSGSIVDLAHTVGTSMLVLGLALVLAHETGPRAAGTWRILSGAGTMTLTLYAVHVMVVSAPDSWPGAHNLLVHLVGAVLIGATFAALRRRGPLEQVVGQLSTSVGHR